MAGAIIENMSGRKLAMVGAVLVICQVLSFLVGAIFSPSPNHSDQLLATKCYDKEGPGSRDKPNDKWFYPRGKGACATINDIAETAEDHELGADNVVFSFQMPLPRERVELDYTRLVMRIIC